MSFIIIVKNRHFFKRNRKMFIGGVFFIMPKVEEKTNIDLIQKQKIECIERLKILKEKGLLNEVVKDFEKNNLIYYSEQSYLGGILYYCTQSNGADKFVKLIEEFEEEHKAKVYHAIHCYTEYGELLNLMYVSAYKDEWEQDKQDLKDNYVFSYVINLDEEVFSEFGSIGYEIKSGGLVRTY